MDALGMSLHEMAVELGRSQASVEAMRSKARVLRPETLPDPVKKRRRRRRNGASFFLS
jgi:hypothetical protein